MGPVQVGRRQYIDGGVANPLPVRPLLKYRGIRILAILSKPPDAGHYQPNFLERMFFWRYFRKNGWVIRCLKKSLAVYAEQVAFLERGMARHPPTAFIIKPAKMPEADFVTRNEDKINLTVDEGYRAVQACRAQLESFLSPEYGRLGATRRARSGRSGFGAAQVGARSV
jgi:predicted patatin/cPLA2 family phospholipase